MKKHLPLVFKDILDRNHFNDKLYFRDPLTTNLNSFRCVFPCSSSIVPKQTLPGMPRPIVAGVSAQGFWPN